MLNSLYILISLYMSISLYIYFFFKLLISDKTFRYNSQ